MPHSDAEAHASAQRPGPAERAAESPPPDGMAAAQREANAAIRASSALMRTRAASQRDAAARVRDIEAAERDQASAACGRWEGSAQAASDREHAAADRAHAAEDRARAADDRREARIALRDAHLDELTGVYARGPGLLTLQHEIQRAQRLAEPFVLALIGVDGLRRMNAEQGHAAGDAMLRAVAAQLRARLRAYDPIVRIGGDVFLCAFTNTRMPAAAHRLEEVQAALARNGTITGGLAELHPGETLAALTARADAELDRVKRGG